MHILCVGLSHRTASVELRERVSLNADAAEAALRELATLFPHAELALISTCNRTELYVARPLHGHPRVDELLGFLADTSNLEAEDLAEVVYHYDNEQALRHLLRVAAGLDSMVLGENQIVAQIKQAYDIACAAGTLDKVLHKIFQIALATAKKVRTQTGISSGRTSVSSVAVDFAKHLFSRLGDKTVLTIGAGKMTELTLTHFLELRPERVLICNRSAAKAHDLAAKYHGEAAAFEDLDEHLVKADVVISSTGASQPIVDAAMFKPLIKRRRFRPLFVIDIAMPRDFDPAIGELANVYLYNLDDLQKAISDDLAQRNGEVANCESIVDAAVLDCYAAIQTGDFAELIQLLRRQIHDIASAESERTANKLAVADPDQHRDILDEHAHRLVNKILHRPLSELRANSGTEAAMYATALRRLFVLDQHQQVEDLHPPEQTTPPSRR
ncbi:MAG: glutamyl-tRNA reductase [Phycisphaeraceae bacterium]